MYRERERLSLRRGGFPYRHITGISTIHRAITIRSMFLAAIEYIARKCTRQSFIVALCVIKWRRYTACVLQRGSISPADKYNRARTPQEATHTHHSHHSQNHHDHPLHPMKKMKKEHETCKDVGHVSA